MIWDLVENIEASLRGNSSHQENIFSLNLVMDSQLENLSNRERLFFGDVYERSEQSYNISPSPKLDKFRYHQPAETVPELSMPPALSS